MPLRASLKMIITSIQFLLLLKYYPSGLYMFVSFKFTQWFIEVCIIIFSILWWNDISKMLSNCPKFYSHWQARDWFNLYVDRYC